MRNGTLTSEAPSTQLQCLRDRCTTQRMSGCTARSRTVVVSYHCTQPAVMKTREQLAMHCSWLLHVSTLYRHLGIDIVMNTAVDGLYASGAQPRATTCDTTAESASNEIHEVANFSLLRW
eukprot:m.918075 g.918075  ORF g.918075 m.918075 type:complete len:120 (+) comp23739_c0_seq12:3303-3662(+)